MAPRGCRILLRYLCAYILTASRTSSGSVIPPPRLPISGFSIDGGAAPVLSERSPPVLVCPACYFGGLPDPYDHIFASGDVGASIDPADYRPGWDWLAGGSAELAPFDFPFDVARGELRITWPNTATLRTATELAVCLRTLSFAAHGADPTAKGALPTRRVHLFASLPRGGLAAWPPRTVTVAVNASNDAPLCTIGADAGASARADARAPPPVRLFPQGGGASERALLWPPGGPAGGADALALSDVDDAQLTAADVFFAAAHDPAQDALAAWGPGEPVPAGGRIAAAPWDSAGGVLRLTGAASLADYAAALATVGYMNTAPSAPRVGVRLVHAVVTDNGSGTGGGRLRCARAAAALAGVAPANEAPEVGWAVFPPPPPPTYELSLGGAAAPPLAPFSIDAGRAVVARDVDDSWVSAATVALPPYSCFPGEDVLWYDGAAAAAAGALPGATAPPATLAAAWNGSACTLTLAPSAVGGREALTLSALPAALAGVFYANRAAAGVPAGGGASRTLELTITDGGVGGALPASGCLSSPPLPVSIALVARNAPPVPFLAHGTPWVLAGAPEGTPVGGGVVSVSDDGEPAQALRFFVSGGSAGPGGADAFVVDAALGTLRVNAGGVDAGALGPAPTLEVTVWDRPAGDSAGKSATLSFTVAVVDAGALAAALSPAGVAAVAAAGSLPVLPPAAGLPPAARPFLLHGAPSAACVDVAAAFSPAGGPGGALEFELLWHAFEGAPGVVVGGRGAAGSLPAALARAWQGGTLSWGAPPGSGGGVQCVAGVPQAPAVRVEAGGRALRFAPAPAELLFSVRATPAALYALGVAEWPSPPPAAAAAPLRLRIEVAGCMDPAAAYVPCVVGGRAVADEAALAALAAPRLRVEAGPPCDNMCWDGTGAGACDNACALPLNGSGACGNPPLPRGGTSAAANPGGNFDPLASVPPQSYAAAACVYPPRAASASLRLPLRADNVAAFAAANRGGGGAAATAAAAGRPALGRDTGALPFLTSTNDSAVGGLRDDPQLRLLLPPVGLNALPAGVAHPGDLPPANAVGAATLELPLGALDALVAAAAAPGGALASAAAPGAPPRVVNVSLPVALARLAWPLDVPLPPLGDGHRRGGPQPVIDVHSLLRISPGGVPLPAATAPARLCVWTAPPDVSLAAAWGADPARRVAPLLLAAALADPGEGGGGGSGALSAARAAAAGGAANASSFDAASVYAWLPRSGFGAWEVLPLLAGGGNWWAPGVAAGVAGAGAGGVPAPARPPSGRLCAELAVLPALVAVAWAPPPAGPLGTGAGSWTLRADVNTDVDDGEGAAAAPHVSASSHPSGIVPLAGALFFAASSGPRRQGRELWTTGELAGGGAAGFLWEEEAGAATLGVSAAATALSVAALLAAPAGGASNVAPLLLALPGGLPAPAAPAPGPYAPVAAGPHATLVADLFSPGAPGASSSPAWLTPFAGKLLFAATGARGRELWAWAPRARGAGAFPATPLPPPPGGEPPLAPGGGDDTAPPAPYPAAYRRQLAALRGGGGGARGHAPHAHADAAARRALAAPAALAPTSALFEPPQLLADLWPGTGSSNPAWLTPLGNALLFAATAPPAPPASAVPELWLWRDATGSAAAPRAPERVARTSGSWPLLPAFSDPRHLAACAGALFFAADGGAGVGRELWRAAPPRFNDSAVDPFTPALGSRWEVELVADIEPGGGSSAPAFLFCVPAGGPGGSDLLFFTAWDSYNGREAWVYAPASGAPPGLLGGAGLAPAAASAPAATSAFPGAGEGASPHWALHEGALFFAADDGSTGAELWALPCSGGDGGCGWPPGPGAGAPALVDDAVPGAGGAAPAHMVSYAGALHMAATLPAVGRELVALHPATRKLVLVANLDVAGEALPGVPAAGAFARGGDGSSNPTSLSVAFGRLWFAADDGDGGHGVELFSYHAAPAGGAGGGGGGGGGGCGRNAVALAPGACGARLTAGAGATPGDAFGFAVAVDAGTDFGLGAAGGDRSGGSSFAAGDRGWAYSTSPAGAGAPEQRPLGMRAGDAGAALGVPGGRVVAVGAPHARGGAGAVRAFSAVPWGVGWAPDGGVELFADDGVSAGGDAARGVPGDGVGDTLGFSVAVAGAVIAAGAPRAALIDAAGAAAPAPGAGRVLAWAQRSGGAAGWSPEGALPHPPGGACGGFCALGTAVAAFGAAVVAGGPGAAGGVGGAWVWVRAPEGGWRLAQALDPLAEAGVGAALVARGAPAPTAYGCAVGATYGMLAVSACGGGGAVFLWRWAPGGGGDGGRWGIPGGGGGGGVLTAPAVLPFSGGPPLAGAGAAGATGFGAALSLHGTLLAVGATALAPAGAPSGAPPGGALLYGMDESGSWLPLGGSLAADLSLAASGGRGGAAAAAWFGAGGGGYGAGVAVTSAAPPALLVGAAGALVRGGYAGSGGAIALEPAPGSGSWEGLRALGGTPLLPAALLSPADSAAGDAFGWAVAAGGDAAAVGAPGAGAGAGAVYVSSCATPTCGGGGVFTARGCSPAHDRVCAPCSAGRCPPGTWETAPCTAFEDRVCAPCTAACPGSDGPPPAPCAPAADARCDAPPAAAPAGGGSSACDAHGSSAECASAPLPGGARRTGAPRPPPPLPPDAGAAWRLHGALTAAFNASGGAAGLWRGATGTAWAAHLAAGTAPCSGVDSRGAPPRGFPPGPWPGLTCAVDDAPEQVTAIALPGVGLHGTATAWLRGDATPWLTRVDLSGNPALALCGAEEVVPRPGGGGVCWGAKGAPPALMLPPALDTLDLSGTALGGGTFPVALLNQLPALRALSLWTAAGSGAGSDADLLQEAMEGRGGVVVQ
jgi:hypothetical protein